MTKEELEKQTMEWKNKYILKLEKEIQDFKETNHELAELCIQRKKRIAELEEKLVGKENEFKYFSNSFKKKIADLKKLVKDLGWQLQEVARDNDIYQAENKRLEKENAELEKSCDETQVLLNKQIEATYKVAEELKEEKEKLIKTKDLLKRWLRLYKTNTVKGIITDTELFLKGGLNDNLYI